jgi:hypothetical protein
VLHHLQAQHRAHQGAPGIGAGAVAHAALDFPAARAEQRD